MRPELEAAGRQHARLVEAVRLSAQLYALVEQGADFSPSLRELARIAGKPIAAGSLMAAFGSTSSEAFARKQLLDWHNLPSDLSHGEMLELLDRICNRPGDETDTEYWLECLRVNTGDDKISDLIFWPDEYFGKETRELEPVEMLRVALESGASGRVT